VPPAECLVIEGRPAPPSIALTGRLTLSYFDQTVEVGGTARNSELGSLRFDDGVPRVRRLTHNLVSEEESTISPDGRKLLYAVRPFLGGIEDNTEIWMADVDGSNPTLVLSGPGISGPAWVHDGGRSFLYARFTDTETNLFRFEVATGGSTLFIENSEGDATVSYDGELVTFKRTLPGDRDQQPSIYVARMDGTCITRLTSGWSDHDPSFSRDGTKIFFERYYGPGDWAEASGDRVLPEHSYWAIVEVDIATKRERVVVPHDPCGRHFYWLPTVSPDGDSIMYIHNDNDPPDGVWTDLWVSRVDGRDPQKVPGSDWLFYFDWVR
jgi:Tol biopolymer transport system component